MGQRRDCKIEYSQAVDLIFQAFLTFGYNMGDIADISGLPENRVYAYSRRCREGMMSWDCMIPLLKTYLREKEVNPDFLEHLKSLPCTPEELDISFLLANPIPSRVDPKVLDVDASLARYTLLRVYTLFASRGFKAPIYECSRLADIHPSTVSRLIFSDRVKSVKVSTAQRIYDAATFMQINANKLKKVIDDRLQMAGVC